MHKFFAGTCKSLVIPQGNHCYWCVVYKKLKISPKLYVNIKFSLLHTTCSTECLKEIILGTSVYQALISFFSFVIPFICFNSSYVPFQLWFFVLFGIDINMKCVLTVSKCLSPLIWFINYVVLCTNRVKLFIIVDLEDIM